MKLTKFTLITWLLSALFLWAHWKYESHIATIAAIITVTMMQLSHKKANPDFYAPLELWMNEFLNEFLNKFHRPKTQRGIEFFGRMLSLLLPVKARERYFEPYFEDLKQDMAEHRRRRCGAAWTWWLNFCLVFRLIITLIQSIKCTAIAGLLTIIPYIKELFFR